EPDLHAAIAVVRRAGVLVEPSTDSAALRFDHPLVREVLLHSLGAARRAQLHQRVAEAIAAYHHDDVDRFSADLAHHLASAARVLVRLATELHFAGDRDHCLALCADAETIARHADDTDALAAVFSARHYALYGAPDVQERLALVAEIQGLRTVARPQHRWLRN